MREDERREVEKRGGMRNEKWRREECVTWIALDRRPSSSPSVSSFSASYLKAGRGVQYSGAVSFCGVL
jgi:hypothetical protein